MSDRVASSLSTYHKGGYHSPLLRHIHFTPSAAVKSRIMGKLIVLTWGAGIGGRARRGTSRRKSVWHRPMPTRCGRYVAWDGCMRRQAGSAMGCPVDLVGAG